MKMQHTLNIAADHPAFSGHFPAFPVLPGAVLLDQMFKVLESAHGIDLKSWHISSVKFFDAVRPGDSLTFEHEAPSAGLIRFAIRAGDRKIAGGSLHES
jgi:3-hydroxymyristoyl/3-hydroxydecanoyl-(acyl carrier protein) dehydratase